MLVLFETPAGYAVFKLLDEGKLAKSDSLYEDFETIDKAKNVVKLKKFQKFEDTTEALGAATALVEGKMSKSLKKMLKKIVAEDAHEKLAVADAKLGSVIKDKLEMNCVYDSKIGELMRCIRSQASGLISGNLGYISSKLPYESHQPGTILPWFGRNEEKYYMGTHSRQYCCVLSVSNSQT